ncbi:hypothetical protein AVEN_113289-1 [Araneus ventricosus]|uniref:Uncharacterized protein n=1 Tax=Araneus ventricosus TaxID=182803 RepID=A0A4Y2RJ37_ARAVE|nr:hypothetical protein AVEN_113289-1 [Araneus ventricosus]
MSTVLLSRDATDFDTTTFGRSHTGKGCQAYIHNPRRPTHPKGLESKDRRGGDRPVMKEKSYNIWRLDEGYFGTDFAILKPGQIMRTTLEPTTRLQTSAPYQGEDARPSTDLTCTKTVHMAGLPAGVSNQRSSNPEA